MLSVKQSIAVYVLHAVIAEVKTLICVLCTIISAPMRTDSATRNRTCVSRSRRKPKWPLLSNCPPYKQSKNMHFAYGVGGDNRCDVLPTDRDPHLRHQAARFDFDDTPHELVASSS